MLNDEAVKTRSDSDSPTTRLIAKKAKKLIEPDTVFDVTVENPGGVESEFIEYFRGRSFTARVLPGGPNARGILSELGEYLMATAEVDSATRLQIDSSFLGRVKDSPTAPSGYVLYQTVQRGSTFFYAEFYNGGELGPIIYYRLGIQID